MLTVAELAMIICGLSEGRMLFLSSGILSNKSVEITEIDAPVSINADTSLPSTITSILFN